MCINVFSCLKNDSPCARDVEYKKGGHPSGMMKSIAYWPNSLGIRNFQGNVSEMTVEKGIAYGGNYTLPFSECKPESIQRYTHPEPWLGFRCIVVKK